MGLLMAAEASLAWPGLVWSSLVLSSPYWTLDAGVVAMAWLAAVGAPFGWSMVLFGTGLVSVTNEDGW